MDTIKLFSTSIRQKVSSIDSADNPIAKYFYGVFKFTLFGLGFGVLVFKKKSLSIYPMLLGLGYGITRNYDLISPYKKMLFPLRNKKQIMYVTFIRSNEEKKLILSEIKQGLEESEKKVAN